MENQDPPNPVPITTASQPTQAPAQPPELVKRTSKFSIKLLIGIIIFLLLAGGAAAGYVYREPLMKLVSQPTPTPTIAQASPTSTPDPTAGWQTYSSRNYGFTFKYPNTYTLGAKSTASAEIAFESVLLERDVVWGPGAFGGQTNHKGSVINFIVFKTLDLSEASFKKAYGTQITLEKVMIDTKEGIEIKGESIQNRYIYIPLETGVLSIQTGIAEVDIQKREEYLKDFDQILSTFKFTEPVQTLEFPIPELGLKLHVSEDLDSLIYEVDTVGETVSAEFTTESLVSEFESCKLPQGGIGFISRSATQTQRHTKKIGNYYYEIGGSQAACSLSDSTHELEINQRNQFLKVLETAEPL